MTIFYPDVYSGQAGISFSGAPVAMVKATQGTGYVNPDYVPAKGRAGEAFFCAYHFLEAGNGAAQAAYAFSVVGKVPLMVDFEPTTGSSPSVADAEDFIAAYRKLGGIVHLLYFPHWYWQQLGSPALSGFSSMAMVSSDYTAYSDSGPGWESYGGLTPQVWQYTSTGTFNGHNPVDLNAFKGTIAQFRELATTGTTSAPAPLPVVYTAVSSRLPALSPGMKDSDLSHWYIRRLQAILNYVYGYPCNLTGVYDPVTVNAVKLLQARDSLTQDGVCGPQTWGRVIGG